MNFRPPLSKMKATGRAVPRLCTMIHVRELTKHYCRSATAGSSWPSMRVSFHARPGQVYGLLGPNGAGKTTALRILSTVLRPTGGTATINGFDVLTQPPQVRRQIGFMSANTAVYDRMTGWEMVEYFGRLHGIPRDELADRMESLFDAAEDERHPRHLGREDVDGHEAEGVGGPGGGPRSAGADFRRGHRRARRARGPSPVEHGRRAARSRQVHRLLHAHHARGGETLRPRGDFAPRTPAGRRRRCRNCATSITKTTSKNCSSS